MSGFKNDVVFAKNADFTSTSNTSPSESNGLATDGQLWTGTTAVNAGGTHVNVGTMTSPNNSITFGYTSPNITAVVNTSVVRDLHVTPYIVSPLGFNAGASYSTIQSACDAANAMGGGIVVVQPATYTENLTLYNGVHIMGLQFADAGNGVIINGTHTPPATGGFVIQYVALNSATNVFSSNAAGSAHLVLANAIVTVTNGYTFNVPNWTGKLESFDVNAAVGTSDGYVNNTGGSEIDIFECSVGSGTANTMIVSGVCLWAGANIYCPVDFRTGSNAQIDYSDINKTLTLSNNSTGELSSTRIATGATQAITMNSSANWTLSNCSIVTSNNPSIGGTGAGRLILGDTSFVTNSAIASTVLLSSNGTFARTPIYRDEGGSTTVKINSGSFATSAITLTTPVTTGLSDGEVLEIVATNGVVVIQLAATQVAHVGSLATSVAGTITSTATGDVLILRYQVSTNDWWATSVIGTWVLA